MMRRYGDLMASVGEFTDDQGRKAKRWIRCGVVMRDDRTGALSIKIDVVPISPEWSGWFAVRNIADQAEGADVRTDPGGEDDVPF
jgi:hypothetical protein